jgi:hypothetical protein
MGNGAGCFARVSLIRLKVAAGVCGGSGLMTGVAPTAMGIKSLFVCNLLIFLGLGKSEEGENRGQKRQLAA